MITVILNNMRESIWMWVSRNHPEGMVLTKWLYLIKAILFPLKFFYWKMSKAHGYQWETDTWNIEGVRYTGDALKAIAKAQGETYRITRINNYVTFERVYI